MSAFYYSETLRSLLDDKSTITIIGNGTASGIMNPKNKVLECIDLINGIPGAYYERINYTQHIENGSGKPYTKRFNAVLNCEYIGHSDTAPRNILLSIENMNLTVSSDFITYLDAALLNYDNVLDHTDVFIKQATFEII